MSRGQLLRGRKEQDAHVGYIELFFDLVFVFAVTQLSHYLIAHLSPIGVVQAAMLFAAVWWAWVYTIWCTNWLNTDAWPVRLMLFLMMAGGLVLAMAIPRAFETAGLLFAIAFAALQVGRSLFMMAVLYRRKPSNFRNFQRITLWCAASGALWIAGGLAASEVRIVWWLAALAVDFAGPSCRFAVPGMGASATEDWNVEAHHLSERCGAFVIIALGESVLLTGATFSGTPWVAGSIVAFVSAFATTAAMWWVYFNVGAEEATERFAGAEDTGKVARLSYTYLHMPIIAGIIINAASDELVIAHPLGAGASGHGDGGSNFGVMALLVGGPALFLFAVLLFKRFTVEGWRLSHLVGLAALAALFIAAITLHGITPLVIGVGVTAIFVMVATWETLARARPARPELSAR
ncbi:low temperature requirement protein A [soil metagenome]